MNLKLDRLAHGIKTDPNQPPVLGFNAAALLSVLFIAAAVRFRWYVRHQKSVDARYKAIIDQANDGIVIADAKTQELLYTNPAILSRLGYTSAEAKAPCSRACAVQIHKWP